MPEIIEHKPHNITIGVLDKSVQLHEDLQSVTYADRNGTYHTVHAHVNGPFGSPEDIVAAAENGTLHTFESHDAALAYWADHGDPEYVERLQKSIGQDKPTQPDSYRGG
jgi:hypothetical protein